MNSIRNHIPLNIKLYLKEKLWKLQAARMNGEGYICPFCLRKSRKFGIIGQHSPALIENEVIGAGRRRAGCYNCGSKDRERLVFIYLKEKLSIFDQPDKLKILHFAPERNLSNKLRSAGFAKYICGDLFSEGYEYPDYVEHIDVLDIPYKANTFDLVICNHVLEHVPDDIGAMKEIYRVLKKGGKSILQTPISKIRLKTIEDPSIIDPEERRIKFGQSDHVRIYGQDYQKKLESVGFLVSRINISEEYSIYGLNPEEDLFIGNK